MIISKHINVYGQRLISFLPTRAIFGAISCALISGLTFVIPSQASMIESFDCSPREGVHMEVILDMNNKTAKLREVVDDTELFLHSDGIYRGQTRYNNSAVFFDPITQTFGVESEQWPCLVMLADNEMQNHDSGAVGGKEIYNINVQGRALGGNMRNGPGTNFRKIGSASEGTPLTILTNTGVQFDGYDWFEVALDSGARGYIWGGILCSNGPQLAGLYQTCKGGAGQRQMIETTKSTSNRSSGGAWMAFAIGPDGKWGHGHSSSLNDARQIAMDYCNDRTCLIRDETQAKCHVLVLEPRGHWFGAASSSRQAQQYALDFCTNSGAQGCRIEYTYCQ